MCNRVKNSEGLEGRFFVRHSYAGPEMGESFAEIDPRRRQLASSDDHLAHSQQIRFSSNELHSLASRIFHDINNRLLVIQFASAKLLRGLSSDDLNYCTVLAIEEARQQASDLANQFRDAQKSMLVKCSTTDLNELLRGWEPLIKEVARENVVVNLDLTLEPAMTMVRQETVERILLNLILAELASISGGGKLNLQTSFTDTQVSISNVLFPAPSGFGRLRISETSCELVELTALDRPIAEKALENHGKRAEMLRSTIEAVGKIVRDCGGQLSVTTSIETGTRIDISFPKAPPVLLSTMPTCDHLQAVSGSETILLVDDDTRVRGFIKSALESRGYNVIEAHDGISAVNIASEHSESLHLLLTDLQLGGTSGREIADRLRTDYPGLPVIFMSGLATDDLDLDASSTFLEKPFNPMQLITMVRRLLDNRKNGAGSQSLPKND
jgi:two-component system, cell cycle sensor histidine kinase and response regulator CckA